MADRPHPRRPMFVLVDYEVSRMPVVVCDDGTCWSLAQDGDGGMVWTTVAPTIPGTSAWWAERE